MFIKIPVPDGRSCGMCPFLRDFRDGTLEAVRCGDGIVNFIATSLSATCGLFNETLEGTAVYTMQKCPTCLAAAQNEKEEQP